MTSQWGFAERADSLNYFLPALVAALDEPTSPARLAWLDRGMDCNSDYAYSAHPDDQGCRKMAAAWMDALVPVLRDRFGFTDAPDGLLPSPRKATLSPGFRDRDALGRRPAPKSGQFPNADGPKN